MLAPLGIGEFDERVYRACLAQPDQTTGELAGGLGATTARVRHALTRLEGMGLIRRAARGRYQPVSPQSALSTLLHQRRLAAETAFTMVDGAVEELAAEYRAGRLHSDPGGLVEVISGRDVVNRRIGELLRSVRSHLWVLDKPPYADIHDGLPPTNDIEIALTVDMLDRGVDLRSVYCPESMERQDRFATVVHLTRLGEQSRILPKLPYKLRIMDRRVALVPLVGGIYDSLAVVHPSGLLDALMDLFESYWERARPILPADAAPEGPTPADLLLLRMLVAGLKDQAIARQLGISPRTATRRIATLMAGLGAETRFQAGAAAAQRGWI